MITKFKIFEALNEGKPEIGDYAIINLKTKKYNNILIIGEIYNMTSEFYSVKFRLPDNRVIHEIFYEHEIKYWSNNREELEKILTNIKYNI